MNWTDFGAALHREGLVADPVLPARAAGGLPWYSHAASALGAWFAAMFLLGFLGGLLYMLWETWPLRALAGVALCAAAIALVRKRDSPFFAQFALAVGIAGVSLLLSAVVAIHLGTRGHLLVCCCVFAALWWLNPEPVHRALMALGAVSCGCAALLMFRLEPFVTLLASAASIAIWLNQARWAVRGIDDRIGPLGHACALALLTLQVVDLLPKDLTTARWLPFSAAIWRATILAIALAAAALLIAQRLHRQQRTVIPASLPPIICVAVTLIALATWRMPGVLACLLVWLLGTWAGRAQLSWIALAGLTGYLTMQYYAQQTTLMQKGVTLLVTGLVLAAIMGVLRWMRGRSPGNDTVGGTRSAA